MRTPLPPCPWGSWLLLLCCSLQVTSPGNVPRARPATGRGSAGAARLTLWCFVCRCIQPAPGRRPTQVRGSPLARCAALASCLVGGRCCLLTSEVAGLGHHGLPRPRCGLPGPCQPPAALCPPPPPPGRSTRLRRLTSASPSCGCRSGCLRPQSPLLQVVGNPAVTERVHSQAHGVRLSVRLSLSRRVCSVRATWADLEFQAFSLTALSPSVTVLCRDRGLSRPH